MAQDLNELINPNPAAPQRLNMPVDVEVEPARVRMGAFVEGGGRPPAVPPPVPPVRGHNGSLLWLAVLLAALAALFAGVAAFKPAGVSQPALEATLATSSGELAKQLARVVADTATDIKAANDKFATDVAGKVGEGVGAVFVKETETRHADLLGAVNGIGTKVDAVATKVDGVVAGQADTTKLVKSLRWQVRKVAQSAAAAPPTGPNFRSVTVVAPDGERHTINLRDY